MVGRQKSKHHGKKLTPRTHMWTSHLELLAEQNEIQWHGHWINRLGSYTDSGDQFDNQTAMVTTNFITGFCTTGQRMHQWGKRETATCPHCEHETKTTAHILQCLHPGTQTISDSCIKDLRSIVKDLDMEPETMEDLSKGFNSWHLNHPTPPMRMATGQLQSFISWENFSHGFLATNWQSQQQLYYNSWQLWRSSIKWIAEVLQWVLQHAHKQWDHRNDKLHRQNPNRVKDLTLNANICKQYEIGINKITKPSQSLLRAPLKAMLNLPHNDKKQWLASVKAAWNR